VIEKEEKEKKLNNHRAFPSLLIPCTPARRFNTAWPDLDLWPANWKWYR